MIKSRFLLFFIFMFFSMSCLGKVQCHITGQKRFIKSGKKITQTISFCADPEDNYFIEYFCYKRKKCNAMRLKKLDIHISELTGPFGNPSHKICHLLGGIPQICEFKINKNWHETSICMFQDGSFISTQKLLGQVKL